MIEDDDLADLFKGTPIEKFLTVPAGKFAAIAFRYLEAANLLTESHTERARALALPTYFLAGQGLEMML